MSEDNQFECKDDNCAMYITSSDCEYWGSCEYCINQNSEKCKKCDKPVETEWIDRNHLLNIKEAGEDQEREF